MIVQQNNPMPLVVLIIFIMVGCVVTGMLLGNMGPLNSQRIMADVEMQQTQSALDVSATKSAFEIEKTQQAPLIQQTEVVAQMTTIPLQQTATQVAMMFTIQDMQTKATQTAIADGVYIQSLANNATATAIAQKQAQDHTANSLNVIAIVVGILAFSTWVIARAVSHILTARAREKTASAQLLAEQRRLALQRYNIQVQKAMRGQSYPLPKSLIQKLDSGKKLPNAE